MNMTTIKAKKGGKGKKMRTREVRIRPAENGFTVSHDQEPETPDKKGMGMYPPPTETVHETPESMLAHVGGIFGAKAGAPPAPAGEPDGDEGE